MKKLLKRKVYRAASGTNINKWIGLFDKNNTIPEISKFDEYQNTERPIYRPGVDDPRLRPIPYFPPKNPEDLIEYLPYLANPRDLINPTKNLPHKFKKYNPEKILDLYNNKIIPKGEGGMEIDLNSLADQYTGRDLQRRIAENLYHSRMADNYFNGKGDGNLLDYAKGAYHWFMSKPKLGGRSEALVEPIEGEVPAVGIGKISSVMKFKEAIKSLSKLLLKNLAIYSRNMKFDPKTEEGAKALLDEIERARKFVPKPAPEQNFYTKSIPEYWKPSWRLRTLAQREMGDDWWSLP